MAHRCRHGIEMPLGTAIFAWRDGHSGAENAARGIEEVSAKLHRCCRPQKERTLPYRPSLTIGIMAQKPIFRRPTRRLAFSSVIIKAVCDQNNGSVKCAACRQPRGQPSL